MAAQLPKHISEFFERTTRIIDERHLPSWLISEFHDERWRINIGIGDVREVNGKVKGGVELNWGFKFPGHKFTEKEYAIPLAQAKMILIAGVDCCFSGANLTKLSIDSWHRFLMWFSEYLAVKYGLLFQCQGFQVAVLDDVGEYLTRIESSGVAGTGLYIERWQKFLFNNCENSDPKSEAVQTFLLKEDAYDRYGELKSDFVANAIQIDSHRLRLSSCMRRQLLLFNRGKTEINRLENSFISQTADAVSCFRVLSEVMRNSVINSSNWPLSDASGVSAQCQAFKVFRGRRTKTLPLSVSKKLVHECCRWMIDTAQETEYFIDQVCEKALDISQSFPNYNQTRCLWEAEQAINQPPVLLLMRKLGAKNLSLLSDEPPQYLVRRPICFFVVRLHVAICFTAITLLSCSRRSEILELEKNALFKKNDRYYLSMMIRKRGMEGIRLSMNKPVPHLVEQCIGSLTRIEVKLATVMKYEDPLSSRRLFFKATVQGLCPLKKDDVIPSLAVMSKFFGLVGNDGKEWQIKPHQLRRHFAMTFFHSGGGESALPALAWFMGHEDISSVWRYIREDLTGREISEAEAAMATAALFSPDESEGVSRLRKVVLEHFGCDEMSVMNEDDTLDYLEMLADRGAFTAQPIQLGAGRRNTIYTVLISVSEERMHATVD